MMNKEHNIQQMINYIYILAQDVRVEHNDVLYGDEDANLKLLVQSILDLKMA